MTGGLILLAVWSGISAVWWTLAVWLVNASRTPGPRTRPREQASPLPSLSLFKPLPFVADDEVRRALAAAIESFLPQLDASAELILGVPSEQEAEWRPFLDRWNSCYPETRIRTVVRPMPRQRANPKVAWMEILAPEARNAVWLWSDADIVAPPNLVARLREDLAAHPEAGAVTAPYGVRFTARAAGWLDALFVNMEFLPGTLLLGRIGPVPLAFGAAILFPAERFRERISWSALGASLADDHELGRQLAPVFISDGVAETCALETRLGPALRHIYRWQKTIRWCRPGGFAALLVILPLIGWGLRCLAVPSDPGSWAGLLGQHLLEVLAAAILLNRVDFRGPAAGAWALLAWPILRVLVWLAAWLPIPVTWGEHTEAWSEPTRNLSREGPDMHLEKPASPR